MNVTAPRRFTTGWSRLWYATCTLLGCLLPAVSEVSAKSLDVSLGLPIVDVAVDSSLARWGERLFFDTRLSADGSMSCGSCHLPERTFADVRARSRGHRGIAGTRNAPSLLNAAHMKSLFWDGRAPSLEQQARAPFINPAEHALTNHETLQRIVTDDPQYAAEIARSRPNHATPLDWIVEALAAYERTLLSGGSRFDRYYYGEDRGAMSGAAIRGMDLFRGRANCTSCHSIGAEASLFTDHSFHVAARGVPANVGEQLPELAQQVVAARSGDDLLALDNLIARDETIAALGRFLVTLDPADIGKFKTPSLRNVALTAPYMHDGGVATLADAVELELYSRGIVTYPIILTRAEKLDLIEFLQALSGAQTNAHRVAP